MKQVKQSDFTWSLIDIVETGIIPASVCGIRIPIESQFAQIVRKLRRLKTKNDMMSFLGAVALKDQAWEWYVGQMEQQMRDNLKNSPTYLPSTSPSVGTGGSEVMVK